MTGPKREDGAPWRNFYGRRHGKSLRKGQRELLETRLAELMPAGVGWDENPERRQLDPTELFPGIEDGPREVWLEIGFGGGEHMIAMARAHSQVGIIGCEAYINGVAMLLSAIERAGISNLAIHPGDARDLLDVLPDASVTQVFLLYPDPWPKKRHHKRRFINPQNLEPLARVMAPGAALKIATDIADYVRHALEQIDRDPRFEWLASRASDWREPWSGWPGTRYEAKALREGRRPCYLSFRRRP